MKSKTHEVTIRVRFDAPLTAKQARYAVWNNVTDLEIYGTGRPGKDDWAMPESMEPYGVGKITVRR